MQNRLAERYTTRTAAHPAHVDSLAGDTVAVILAGGRGTRLRPLTRHICKPALPFGGAYRNIDFSLANCVNSGIARIGVATQHQPRVLLGHLERVWGASATAREPFIAAWRGEECAPGVGYCGTADAVYRNLDTIERLGRRLVLVLAGDHVYQMDYRPMLERHCARGAVVTVGCVEVPVQEAREFGVLSVDRTGRIDRFVEKPKTLRELPEPDASHVPASMGIYVFEAEFLAHVLRLDALNPASSHDFGADILPRLIRESEAYAYRFAALDGGSAYWRDIGTIAAYWRAHMELLEPSSPLRLDDPDWPLPASGSARAICTDGNHAAAVQSLIARHATIRGRVRRSVLFEGVEIQRGADVADSVVLPNAVVEAGCRLRGVIVDSGCRVPRGTVLDRSLDGALRAARLQPAVLTADDPEGFFAVTPEGGVLRSRCRGQWAA